MLIDRHSGTKLTEKLYSQQYKVAKVPFELLYTVIYISNILTRVF